MIDPELQRHLAELNSNLLALKKGTGIWRSFFNGMFSALGYVAGLAIIIVILGWILNRMGILPDVKQQMSDFQFMMQKAKDVFGSRPTSTQQGSGTYEITLPDGQKVQVSR